MPNLNRPFRQPDYRLETMDDEMLLFNPKQDTVLYFNQTASLIWQLCDGQRSVEDIVALLKEAYPEAASGMAEDVRSVINKFQEHGAIKMG
jgi:hypothetical protein